MWRRWAGSSVAVAALLVVACQAGPAPTTTAVSAPATAAATPAPTQALRVAVAVGSPTPTPQITADYVTLARQQLATIQRAFGRIDQQMAVAQKTPMRMADDDWLDQMRSILQDLLVASTDLHSLRARAGPAQTALSAQVNKVADDVDFVANEYRMAFDYDPDSTHFLRANRAEKSSAAEVDSLAMDLDRSASATRRGSPTPP